MLSTVKAAEDLFTFLYSAKFSLCTSCRYRWSGGSGPIILQIATKYRSVFSFLLFVEKVKIPPMLAD